MIEPSPEILARLDSAVVLWLTTVTAAGQPQTSPVWFLWRDGSCIVYSLPDAPRVRNIHGNPRVALNLDGDGEGGAIVTFEGTAVFDAAGPASTELPDYQAKYLSRITDYGWTAESFARDYPRRIVITPTRLRAY